MPFAKLGGSQPESLPYRRQHVLDEHVRCRAQLVEQLTARLRPKVECEAALVSVHPGIDTTHAVSSRPERARLVAADRLDLDDVGTEIGEQRRTQGAGDHRRGVDHPDSR